MLASILGRNTNFHLKWLDDENALVFLYDVPAATVLNSFKGSPFIVSEYGEKTSEVGSDVPKKLNVGSNPSPKQEKSGNASQSSESNISLRNSYDLLTTTSIKDSWDD